MKIKGFIKNSFLDWDGKIASLIFTEKCNFRCPFCHNSDLITENNALDVFPDDKILNYLIKNKKWIDGVVISGGEPTLQKDLFDFIRILKNEKFLIKLDTNGFEPLVLQKLLDEELLDYVAMDIKSSFIEARYANACGLKAIDLSKIKKSIKLILDSKIDYEFRTTICPNYVDFSDLENIASQIKNTNWIWQNFRYSDAVFDKNLAKIKPYDSKTLQTFKNKIEKIFGKEIKLR